MVDLEDLREAQSRERRSDSLQELPDSFYSDAAEYIDQLKQKRDALDDPYSEEAQRLNDALNTARQVTEAIYERRVGKVVKLSSLSANGVSVDESGMTREEKELYDSVMNEISANHDYVVGQVLENSQSSEETDQSSGESLSTQEVETNQSEFEVGGEPQTQEVVVEAEVEEPPARRSDGGEKNESSTDGYETVRVLESMPEFMGTDGRSYSLSDEDVVVLPKKNAEVLCEKDAAVKLEDV